MSTVLVLLWLVVVKNLCIVYLWGGDWQQEGVTLTQHKAKLILMHISGHKCELVERGIPLTVSAVEGEADWSVPAFSLSAPSGKLLRLRWCPLCVPCASYQSR